MSYLAADILEVLLEADPMLRITTEDDDILLTFSNEKGLSPVVVVVKGPVDNPVNRVTKAMMVIANRMAFCHHCRHMTTKCAVETVGTWGGLRRALGIDSMQKLEAILQRAFPRSKISLL